MVTKERLLTASAFSKMNKSYKGFLTKEEAEQRLLEQQERFGRSTLVCISSFEKGTFFFSDDHCFGVGVEELKNKGFVPCSAGIPLYVKPREILPSGVVTNIQEYIDIFHKDERLIENIDELLEILNS